VDREAPKNSSSLKILSVEDDPISLTLIRETFKYYEDANLINMANFELTNVETLAEALESLSRNSFDLVLMDLNLPDSRGLETLRKLYLKKPGTPVIVITGISDEETAIKALQIGAEGFLIKGQMGINNLLQTISYSVERHRILEKLEKHIEELKHSELRLRNIIEKSADAIVIVDSDGFILFANNACEELFGREKEELLNDPFGFPVEVEKATEVDIVRSDREEAVAEMRVVETMWEGEKAYLASLRDITKRKKAEEELRAMMDLKSEFTSTVSHELRTPLAAIKESIAIVLDGSAGEINAEQDEFLTIAKRNVDRLHRLIDNVLDFSKLESGKIQFLMQKISINTIIKEVIESNRTIAKGKGLSLNTKLEKDIPMARCDSDKINQVLYNLLSNALKFTEKGGVTISAKKASSGNMIKVCVKDTGGGIADEDISKLFRQFSQIHKTAGDRKPGGTGLGLAISKLIVEQHGGEIWVQSTSGEGSSFCFTLPIWCDDSKGEGFYE